MRDEVFSRSPSSLLRTHVLGCAHDHTRVGHSGELSRPGNTKIRDLGNAVIGHEYVLRLQIPMDDVLSMGNLESQGHLTGNAEGLCYWELPSLVDEVVKSIG